MTELMESGRLDIWSLLDAERAELLSFLGDPDVPEWAAWSVKGVALHLLGDDLSILSRQRDGEPSRVAIEAGSDWQSLFVALDRHNEQWGAASRHFSVR